MTTTHRNFIRIALGIACLGGVASAQPVTPFTKGGGNNKGGNADCAWFCDLQFGDGTVAANNCIKQATKKTGLCYQCGPMASSSTLTACSGTCVNLQTDASHCGACTTACTSGQTCTSGACTGGGGGTECGRFDGTNSGTWETKTPYGSYGGFTDYTPSGQTGLFYDDQVSGTLGRYDVAADSWSTLAGPGVYDNYAGFAWVGTKLYMVSGTEVLVYDITGASWSTALSGVHYTEMSQATSDGAGHVFAVDSDGHVIRYDIASNTATYPGTIPTTVYEPRVTFDACSGKLIIGPAYYDPWLDSVDPTSGAVTTLTPHPEGMVNDIFCSDHSGHIYAAGDYSIPLTFWKYDIATDTWSRMPDLPSPKENNGSCTVADDGYLYVFGGSGGPLMRIKLN